MCFHSYITPAKWFFLDACHGPDPGWGCESTFRKRRENHLKAGSAFIQVYLFFLALFIFATYISSPQTSPPSPASKNKQTCFCL